MWIKVHTKSGKELMVAVAHIVAFSDGHITPTTGIMIEVQETSAQIYKLISYGGRA